MSGGRSHAYLDLTALPAVGSALLSDRPTLLWSADGRSVLWANAAGARFLGERSMAALLDRRFSQALPSSEQIARFARSLPAGASRMERIRFAAGGRFASLPALCARLALPGDTPAVLVSVDPDGRGAQSAAARASELVDLLGADDRLIAILDEDGEILAASGGFDTLAAGEAAIEDMVERAAAAGERLVKRAIRTGDVRRAAGLAHADTEAGGVYLLIVGPPERIMMEPAAPSPRNAPIAEAPAAETETSTPATAAETEPPPAAAVAGNDAEPAGAAQETQAAEAAPSEPAAEPEPQITMTRAGEEPADAEPVGADAPPEDAAPVPLETIEAETAAATMEPEPEPPSAEMPEGAAEAPAFAFVAPTGPTRFVFQMDAEGRFTFVSPDLGSIVGPRSAAISGRSWRDVAAERGLDADGAVAAIIARRDTWSGVSLAWPVDDSDERVAVDLAALPAFSRERAFEGYRGFGVIRPLDRRREPAPKRPDGGRLVGPVWPSEPDEPPVAPAPPEASPAAPEPAAPAEPAPTNIVRLPRAQPAAADAERLTMPEQDAFRRIAVALGAGPVPEPAAPKAEPPSEPPSESTAQPVPLEMQDAATTTEPAPAEPAAVILAPEPDAAPMPEPEPAESRDPAPAPEIEATPLAALAQEGVAAAERAEERLAAAEQKVIELESILDTATDGVIVVDGEGRIERINRSAEALFGVETAAVEGSRFADLFAEESRKSALDYLDGLARNGVASVLNDGREVIGCVPQGGLIPLFMTMGRLAGTERFCAVLRDITQWKNAEEELINARRAAENASMQKSDFLAKVSHEIRTPLNAIIGFSEVMMEERFGPIGTERYKEYLRDIHISGAHLMSLLNDLLDLSKIEAGKMDLAFEAVALNEIVMECVALMQPQANRERIIIRTSLSGQVPSVVADSRSIRQIVLNLVSNAVKFTLAGGQVIVSTVLEESGEVTLRIRDTGIGMSEKDIETALKPFRQLTAASKPRSDGTGLGLPLTKALVEANRAAFVIDSSVGQGTLIRITFPATRVLAG